VIRGVGVASKQMTTEPLVIYVIHLTTPLVIRTRSAIRIWTVILGGYCSPTRTDGVTKLPYIRVGPDTAIGKADRTYPNHQPIVTVQIAALGEFPTNFREVKVRTLDFSSASRVNVGL